MKILFTFVLSTFQWRNERWNNGLVSLKSSIDIFRRMIVTFEKPFCNRSFLIYIVECRSERLHKKYTLAQLICWIRKNECSNSVERKKNNDVADPRHLIRWNSRFLPRTMKRRKDWKKNGNGMKMARDRARWCRVKCISLRNGWNNFYVARFC